MNKISAAQVSFFLAAFLIASIAVNGLLFNSNTRLQSELFEGEARLIELQQLQENRQLQTDGQSTRLEQMDGQQQELVILIKELQTELGQLHKQYENSIDTADLTNEQLRLAALQKLELDEDLASRQQAIESAQVTIANQQRLIQQLNSTPLQLAKRSTEIQALLNELNSRLSTNYSDITLTESAEQTVSIDIPNSLLFVDGDVEFTTASAALLTQLSKALLTLTDVDFDVVGHSDARPIVSDLRLRFPNNWALSSARASLVVADLVANGLTEDTLTAAGKASNTPIREAETEEAWSVNRRIEIIVHF